MPTPVVADVQAVEEDGDAGEDIPLDISQDESRDKKNDSFMARTNDSDTDDRMSGVAGKDYIRSFPQSSGKTTSDKPAQSSSAPASDTFSRWMSGVKKWSQKQTAEITSGKTWLRTKQQISEQMGSANKTVDNELMAKVDAVKEMEHDLKVLSELTKELAGSMAKAAESQLALSACFEHLSKGSNDIAAELLYHQRAQDLMGKNSVGLIETLNFFRTQVLEFVKSKMAAVWAKYGQYDKCRIEYDACRMQYESLKDTQSPKLPAAEAKFLEAYNRMGDTRTVAFNALVEVDKQKTELLRKQLDGMSNAVVMYITGNHAGMEDARARLETAKQERLAPAERSPATTELGSL
eukprot:m.11869 g.11869  ORF g.11869 m.11869 type:complete len:350 (+) comp4548_c0_seq1:100-1149(+)